MQDIQFLEFMGGSNWTHAHSNYLFCLCNIFSMFLNSLPQLENEDRQYIWGHSCDEFCYNPTQCHTAASISMRSPENWTISVECNTWWFMLLLHVWIVVIASAIVVLSWLKLGERRKKMKSKNGWFATLAMLSSSVNIPVADESTVLAHRCL